MPLESIKYSVPVIPKRGSDTPRIGSLVREKSGLPDLIIGMSVLSKLHLYIAYKERKLYITEAGSPVPPAAP